MRYLIKFAYDGSGFFGYQKQPDKRTVENELEKALYCINDNTETKVIGAGRTDSGVHALCQCAHFNLIISITPYKLKCALNSFLPEDIHVYMVCEVDENFHSRYMVRRKTYRYYLSIGEYNPIDRKYIYQYNKNLDIDAMKEAINLFIGRHNFKGFVSSDTIKENYERDIFDAFIECRDKTIVFTFEGNGFMKYQIRNMVGILVKIGASKCKKEMILDALINLEKNKFIKPINSVGLYLENIEY